MQNYYCDPLKDKYTRPNDTDGLVYYANMGQSGTGHLWIGVSRYGLSNANV